eukprot:TRINITY_DN3415_c0_g1_i1.p1 TRINITY_DN3415_c0_g1~~TRINITY_DN3415_c0_g1_i1.p1  ORF type:complete len:540 (-),score=183.53 TRINITY_DN3415_c0_g1_i1:145-1656(-)
MAIPTFDPSYKIEWDELEIISNVGSGAFAEVYEALRAGERVAVKKMLAQSLDEKNLAEFENEVVLMSTFHSSYIVGLFGACFKPPNMCMVLEFMPNGSLNHLLYDVTQEISWDRRWAFAQDAALGMCYLHTRNPPILHRDLKSGNLLIAEDGRIKITDFGLSRVKLKDGPKEEFQGGTDRWTAPEIFDNEPYTEAADVFSYGAILYEIACRKLPFSDTPAEDVRKLWKRGDRPPIDEDVPSDFEKLIRMCWDQSQYKRPSFKEVVSFLKRRAPAERTVVRISDDRERLRSENEQLLLKKEQLEKKRDEADRVAEREKKRATQLEELNEELERKLSDERNKKLQLDRENADLQRSMRKEGERAKELEESAREAKKRLKEAGRKPTGAREELEKARELADKRVAEENEKFSRFKAQLDRFTEKAEEDERARTEIERKIVAFRSQIEDEKKKREELEREKTDLEKKIKAEVRRAETEKKKCAELEATIEEERRRAAARRRAAGTGV